LGQRRATQSLPNVLQEPDGAERSSLGLIQSQPIQGALRGEPAFRKRLMQKKSRVEQIAQFGDIFRSAMLDPLPGLIQSRGIESQFVAGLQLVSGHHDG
jgi:hypothetical protein